MTDQMVPLSARQRAGLQRRVDTYAGQLSERGMAYLAARGIAQMAEQFKFGEVVSPLAGDERYSGRLAIPTFSARGTPVGISYRCMEDHACHTESHGKYLNTPGFPSRLYNLPAVLDAGDTLCIAEGQIDAVTLAACGLNAVGVPGAQAWRKSSHRLLLGFDRVLFWADRDDKGASMELFARIQMAMPQAELVHLPEGHDVNSYFRSAGRDALLALSAAGDSYNDSEDEVEEFDFQDEGESNDDDWNEPYPRPPF